MKRPSIGGRMILLERGIANVQVVNISNKNRAAIFLCFVAFKFSVINS